VDLTCGESIYALDNVEREVIDCEIILSETAEKMLKHLIEDKELTLFITVRGGGCSGYVYDLDLRDEDPTNEHQILQQNDIMIAVHASDSTLLNGTLIDYEEKLMGGGFKMENPNAQRTCGCGLSFG
jgi:iron-sulfur cluster assembly accessory protein